MMPPPTYEQIKEVLYKMIDAINFMERISGLPDCNDCGKKCKCEYEPMVGQYTRINCPLWKPKEEE